MLRREVPLRDGLAELRTRPLLRHEDREVRAGWRAAQGSVLLSEDALGRQDVDVLPALHGRRPQRLLLAGEGELLRGGEVLRWDGVRQRSLRRPEVSRRFHGP